jgi:hypothetical protein
MVLDKDSIEQLGLAGSSSPFVHDPRRFRVEIDISACSFRPGKKLYDRVQWCLSAERVAPIKFRMACVRGTDVFVCTLSFALHHDEFCG